MSSAVDSALEVRAEVHDSYNEEVDAPLANMVWTHPKVTNYYRNRSGRIAGTSPWQYLEYWRRTREADLGDFVAESADDVQHGEKEGT